MLLKVVSILIFVQVVATNFEKKQYNILEKRCILYTMNDSNYKVNMEVVKFD